MKRTSGKTEIVAAKTLDGVGNDEQKLEKGRVEMLEEARIMREVSDHPNIVRAIGVTIDSDHPMAVMEIIRGMLTIFFVVFLSVIEAFFSCRRRSE